MLARAAIVTGGSRGIGRAICLELGRLGYAVVVNYATRPDAAEEVVAEINGMAGAEGDCGAGVPPARQTGRRDACTTTKAGDSNAGGKAVAVSADVGRAEDRKRLVQTALDKFGRIDVLVNNAGITSQGRKDLLEATEESWDRVFDTNLKGPFFLTQLVANEMIRLIQDKTMADAQIINISSISAHAVSVNRADYCMTKAAIGMMTRLFAVRLAEYGIGVFEICPGVITSDMTAPVKEKYDRLIAEGLWPIRRWGQPEDVAKAVAAVVSGYFPFSTGGRIDVDGGFHIRTL